MKHVVFKLTILIVSLVFTADAKNVYKDPGVQKAAFETLVTTEVVLLATEDEEIEDKK